MPNHSNEHRIVVGVLLGAHGVKGDIRVRSFTEVPENIFKYKPFYNDEGETLFEVQSFRIGKNHFIVSPKPMRDREYWENLKGVKLYVPRTAFEKPGDGEFFVEDLVGLTAVSPNNKTLGVVTAVNNFGAGDLLEIKTSDDLLVLIPFSEEDVPELNLAQGRITVASIEDWQENKARCG